jgi:hypothetical protein
MRTTLRRAIVLLVAAAALTSPAAALAAEPPTILTAGIDAEDRLYVTWSLAPGTAYDHAEFATVPTADGDLAEFFVDGNFADYNCARTRCGGTPASTSYTGGYAVARDRRYFVKVVAKGGGAFATSAVWVIDDAKPVIPGDAPLVDEPSNMPVAGHPFDGASLLPAGLASTASLTVATPPKRVHALLVAGVRVRVTCSATCGFTGELSAGGTIVGLVATGWATGGTRTVVVKPSGDERALLRRRPRTRFTLKSTVAPLEGKRRRQTRYFSVTR